MINKVALFVAFTISALVGLIADLPGAAMGSFASLALYVFFCDVFERVSFLENMGEENEID